MADIRVPSAVPWYLPVMLVVLMSLCGGYIKIVHDMVKDSRQRLEVLQEEVTKRTYLKQDMEDVKRRLIYIESVNQQIPFLANQLNAVSLKLDRMLERMTTAPLP